MSVWAHKCSCWQRVKEAVGSPGPGVMGVCELLGLSVGTKLGPSTRTASIPKLVSCTPMWFLGLELRSSCFQGRYIETKSCFQPGCSAFWWMYYDAVICKHVRLHTHSSWGTCDLRLKEGQVGECHLAPLWLHVREVWFVASGQHPQTIFYRILTSGGEDLNSKSEMKLWHPLNAHSFHTIPVRASWGWTPKAKTLCYPRVPT